MPVGVGNPSMNFYRWVNSQAYSISYAALLTMTEVISMNNSFQKFAAMSVLALVTATSNAEDTQRTPPPPMKGMGMGMHHGMGGMMAEMTEEQKDKHLRSMQEHMLKMHDLSNQILAEKDAAKKEQLKEQQLQTMKAHHAEMMEKHHKMPMK
jgi:hypothetical protein